MAVFYENKDKSIMCPHCGKLLAKADSKDPNTHKVMCKHCRKWIWFVPKDGTVKVHEFPKNVQASGKRFY